MNILGIQASLLILYIKSIMLMWFLKGGLWWDCDHLLQVHWNQTRYEIINIILIFDYYILQSVTTLFDSVWDPFVIPLDVKVNQ